MCTAVVSHVPGAAFPVLLAGVRDEFVARSWEPPGRHWPDRPRLIGGRDLRAGGTWLAVDPEQPRAACVLNGRGRPAPERARRSRGELPLRLAAEGTLDGLEFDRFDPFHLLCAEPDGVRLWSWDGRVLDERALEPGLHLLVNSGLEGSGSAAASPAGTVPDGPADDDAADDVAQEDAGHERMSARIAYFRPRFAAVARPDLPADLPADLSADRTTDHRAAWGAWLPLIDGDGIDPADPRALIVRHDLGGGRVWGTTSVSLVGLAPGQVRYDFNARPGDPRAWRTVRTSG